MHFHRLMHYFKSIQSHPNKFLDLQINRLNQFLNVRKINERKFLKSSLQTSILLISTSRSLTWRARFNFSTPFTIAFWSTWACSIEQFLLQNLIKSCLFSESIFCVDHFGFFFRAFLRSSFVHFNPFYYCFLSTC